MFPHGGQLQTPHSNAWCGATGFSPLSIFKCPLMVGISSSCYHLPYLIFVFVVLCAISYSSMKGRTPNIRYSVAKLSIVAIYSLFERLSQSIERKPSCFRRAFSKSHPAFVELSMKAILLLQSFQPKPSCFRRAFNESHSAFVELSQGFQRKPS